MICSSLTQFHLSSLSNEKEETNSQEIWLNVTQKLESDSLSLGHGLCNIVGPLTIWKQFKTHPPIVFTIIYPSIKRNKV
jgi:hypothetical protein